jgi:hypothetical protein
MPRRRHETPVARTTERVVASCRSPNPTARPSAVARSDETSWAKIILAPNSQACSQAR